MSRVTACALSALVLVLGLLPRPVLAQDAASTDAPGASPAEDTPSERHAGEDDGPNVDASAEDPTRAENDAPSEENASEAGSAGDDHAPADTTDGETTVVRSEDAIAYVVTESSSPAAAVLGTSTVLFGVVTAASFGYFLDRTGQVDTCAAAEAFEESERGCVNRRLIEGQQEVGLGLFIGALSAFAVLATIWAVVAATDEGDDAQAVRVRCAPGLTGLACAGQF